MANVSFVLDAEEAKAVNAFLKVVDAQKKAETGFQRLNSKIDESGKKHETLGGVALSTVGKMAAGWLSVEKAVQAATAVLDKYHEAQERAAGRAKDSAMSLGSLSQVASNPKELEFLVSEAVKTSTGAGMDLSKAAALQFDLKSLGMTDERQMFADLYGTVEAPEEIAKGVAALQMSFGKDEVGSVRQVVNKAFAAAGASSDDLQGTFEAMSQLAPSMSQLKATDEESFAALVALTNARGGRSELASTEIVSLATSMMEHGHGGKGFLAGMGAVEKDIAGKSDDEILKYFGRIEAFKGYMSLNQNMGQVKDAMGVIQGGNRVQDSEGLFQDYTGAAITTRRSNPILYAEEQARIAEQAKLQAEMDRRGVGELGLQASINRTLTGAESGSESSARVASRDLAMSAAKYLGAGESGVKMASDFVGEQAANYTDFGQPELSGEGVLAVLKDMKTLLAGLLAKDNPAPKPTPNMQAE